MILVKTEAHGRQNKHAKDKTRYVPIFTMKTARWYMTISVPSAQLCCEPKAAFKGKSI